MALTPAQQDALTKIAAASVECERKTGCPAELTAAQAILESGWLTSAPGNNAFGIKSNSSGAQGKQYCLTSEFIDGTWKKEPLAFATYATLADGFADHARLLQCGVYEGAWRQYQKDHNLDAFIKGIAAHYATDPGYAGKVSQIAHMSSVQIAVQMHRARMSEAA